MQDGGGGDRTRKPFLIDPAEEGTRPQGVDGIWWISLPVAWLQPLLPKRLRGLPPLFYGPCLAGILWGAAFLFFRVSRLPIPAGMTLEPAPPLSNPMLDAMAIAMAVVGVAQGLGTLYRRKWGLRAAQLWFGIVILWGWLTFELLPDYSPADTICNAFALLVCTAILAALIIYYHNRRHWFGLPDGRQRP